MGACVCSKPLTSEMIYSCYLPSASDKQSAHLPSHICVRPRINKMDEYTLKQIHTVRTEECIKVHNMTMWRLRHKQNTHEQESWMSYANSSSRKEGKQDECVCVPFMIKRPLGGLSGMLSLTHVSYPHVRPLQMVFWKHKDQIKD